MLSCAAENSRYGLRFDRGVADSDMVDSGHALSSCQVASHHWLADMLLVSNTSTLSTTHLGSRYVNTGRHRPTCDVNTAPSSASLSKPPQFTIKPYLFDHAVYFANTACSNEWDAICDLRRVTRPKYPALYPTNVCLDGTMERPSKWAVCVGTRLTLRFSRQSTAG